MGAFEWSAEDVARHLRSSAVFRTLDDAAVERFVEASEVLLVRAGEVVISEGDAGADAFIVIAGRLDVTAASADGTTRTVNHLGPGDVVGEMALLTDERRSATVRARRDSALVRIGSDDFRSIVLDHPESLLDVTRTVMLRLNRSIHDERPDGIRNVIAVLPAGDRPAHFEFARAFADALPSTSVAFVTAEHVRSNIGGDVSEAATTQYLHRTEDANEFVVLVGESGNAAWSELCHRQSDVVLHVGYADSLGSIAEYETDPTSAECGNTPFELVLVHADETPVNTASILEKRSPRRHHHIRHGSMADVERVARIVGGSSVGVVFGGGGARGYAHLGVLKAMLEAGIPIDHVGGASIGSAIASGLAMGLDWDDMVAQLRGVTYEGGGIVDSTLPSVAVARGKRLTEGMRDGYGDIGIEDLWTEFFCVSTDLTEGKVHVHTSGPVWEAVRSSVSIPGVLPPMRSSAGHVLVDGGVLDNVPTAAMKSTYSPRWLIAVDLSARSTIGAADLGSEGSISGWKVARHRVLPWKDRLDVPGILESLIAASTISGSATGTDADLIIRPPVSEFGFLDFAAGDDIIEAGYRHTVDLFDAEGMLDRFRPN